MAASEARSAFRALGKVNRVLLPQLENIRDSRLGKPLFLIYADYKNVFLDLCSFVYKRPLRGVFNFSIMAGFTGVWANCPQEGSYSERLMENANTLLLLSDKTRNPKSNDYVQKLMSLRSENRLIQYDLLFFSLIVDQDYSDTSCYYEAKCYYFKQRWIYLYKRILDVGFLRRWYFLEKAMVDYDVNDGDLSTLPVDWAGGNFRIWIRLLNKPANICVYVFLWIFLNLKLLNFGRGTLYMYIMWI